MYIHKRNIVSNMFDWYQCTTNVLTMSTMHNFSFPVFPIPTSWSRLFTYNSTIFCTSWHFLSDCIRHFEIQFLLQKKCCAELSSTFFTRSFQSLLEVLDRVLHLLDNVGMSSLMPFLTF